VTVNATKREQKAMDIAGAVDVALPQDLGPRGLRGVDELDRVFTDVHIRQRSNRAYANFTIRGQSSADFYNPAAQLYVDGLPQDYALLSQLLPQDLEQAEILYGPQGTLYGRGAVGGVVNLVTRKPDGQLRMGTTAEIDGLGRGAGIQLNAPLVRDTLFADIAVQTRRDHGELHEMATGTRRGSSEDVNGRVRLRYAPTGSPLDVMLTAARSSRSSDEEYFAVAAGMDSREVLPVPSNYRLKTTSYGLHAHYDLGWARLSSLTGYQDRSFDRTVFGSYTPETQRTLSQEFKLATRPAPGRAVDFVVGAYLQDLDYRRDVPAYALASQQNLRSYALFGEATWHVTDRLDLVPGLRLEQERARVDTAFGTLALQRDKRFNATSPKLAANYRLNDDTTVYGLFSTGFKAGGFTRAVTPQNIDFTYDPQKARNFEAGFKAQLQGGRLELAGALYLMRIKDYQLSVGPITGQYLQNVGDAQTRGASLQAQWQATRQLHLRAGLAVNDSQFRHYRDPTGSTTDRSGNTLPYAPKATAHVSAEYSIPLAGGGRLVPHAGLTHVGKTYFDEANTQSQRAYTLLDLGLSWQINRQVSADFYVDNLTDKRYAVYAFNAASFGYGTAYQLGRGRMAGVRVNVQF
jgi:pesticin/yersiniabactin receptor